MTKEETIKHQNDFIDGRDENIIRFIADFHYYQSLSDDICANDNEEIIYQQFANGYCYHFAIILSTMFPGGQICLAAPFGHIVYVYNHIAFESFINLLEEYETKDLVYRNYKDEDGHDVSYSKYMCTTGFQDIYNSPDIPDGLDTAKSGTYARTIQYIDGCENYDKERILRKSNLSVDDFMNAQVYKENEERNRTVTYNE